MSTPLLSYRTLTPPPVLSGYVRFFWELEGRLTPDEPYIHRTMADGCAELVFHYQSPFEAIRNDGSQESSFGAALHGQSSGYKRFVTKQSFGIFGAYLYPFAIPALFSLPASALTDLEVDLTTLLGPDGAALEEQMMLAPDTDQRVSVLAAFLIGRLKQSQSEPPDVFSAIHHIIHTRGLVDVQALAESHFLSRRQFERRFREASGLSPKLFARIIRFQETIKHFGNPDISLTQIAYGCGYYDQSHFIHDFKTFSGHHPKQFFSYQAEGAPVWEKG